MCKIEDCERHEFDRGMCLPHRKEYLLYKDIAEREEEKPKRRRKKIDAVEVVTADADINEERNDTEE